MSGFPFPPLRLMLVSTLAGLVSARWLSALDAAIVATFTLYALLAIFKV